MSAWLALVLPLHVAGWALVVSGMLLVGAAERGEAWLGVRR